jgi:DNA-binding HxlR family transcriptional regulator
MPKRSYGQFCGIARALEIVGERWAFLIVRDLLGGPKRYTDLRRGLKRIPTNILATRLRELEENGVIQRRLLPRPSSSVVYELTPHGRELEDVLLRLGRWGAKSLPVPDEGPRYVDPAFRALRSAFRPEAAADLEAGFEIRFGAFIIHASVDRGAVTVDEGPLDSPDLIIDARGSITPLLMGLESAEDSLQSGRIAVSGDLELFERFVEIFRMAQES